MRRLKRGGVLLRFDDFSIGVACDDRLARKLRSYFGSYAYPLDGAPPDAIIETRAPAKVPQGLVPWDNRGKESVLDRPSGRVIRKDRTGLIVRLKEDRWSVAGDLIRNFGQVVNLIDARYGVALFDRGAAMFHASAVVSEGSALAVVGESGTGKSSVAVRLLERGYDFLSNDRTLVLPSRNGITAHGLPKLPRVNPGTLLAGTGETKGIVDRKKRERYERLGAGELWDLEEKYDLDVRSVLGRRWLLSAPLSAAIVLAWRKSDRGFRVDRLSPGQALEALRAARKTFGAFDPQLIDRTDDALRSTALRVPVYRITGKVDPTGLADLLAQGKIAGQLRRRGRSASRSRNKASSSSR